MHRTRRHSTESASLREAAADAQRWSRQLDRLKAEAVRMTRTDAEQAEIPSDAPPDAIDLAAPEESGTDWVAATDGIPVDRTAKQPPIPPIGYPFPIPSSRQPPVEDAGNAAPPANDRNGSFVFQDDGPQQPVDGYPVDDVPNGLYSAPGEQDRGIAPAASSQQAERLLEQVIQQLTAIRQTLERILAKPGNVVMD